MATRKLNKGNTSDTQKATKKKATPKKWSFRVEMNDGEYKATASSLQEAMEKVILDPAFPLGPKTRAFITFGLGKETGIETWHVPKARRIFKLAKIKPQTLEILAARLSARFNG